MFYYLIKHLAGTSTFSAITIRSVFALLTSFLITLLATPYIINKMKKRKLSQPIREDGPQSHIINKQGTPSMGGLAVNIAVILSCLFWSNLNPAILSLFMLYLPMSIIGLFDDIRKYHEESSKGINAKTKLLAQFIVSGAFTAFILHYGLLSTTLYVPVLNTEFNLGILYVPFIILVITGTSNAVNLTDGLDGLAMGTSSIVILSYGALAYLSGHAIFSAYLKIPHLIYASELLVPAAAILGAGMGFLWYNSYPAQIFMGDTGSLALGSAIGGIAVLIKQEILLTIMGGIFVLEAISVILQVSSFKLRKKKIFRMAPIHHHFELKGWHEAKVVFRFWLIALILTLFGFIIIGLNILLGK